MCGMAFELHSIVIHRLYFRSFVLAKGKKRYRLKKTRFFTPEAFQLDKINTPVVFVIKFTTRKFYQFFTVLYINRFVSNF